jgi:type I restriction enzyme S subunit
MSRWKECKLGDVAEITSSKRIYYSEYVANGVPFFRSKEIIERFNRQNTSTELFIRRERFEEIRLKFGAPQEGDMLLTSVGTLGIPYLVQKEDEFYFKDGNLTWFRNIDPKVIDKYYLYFYITSDVGQQKLYEASIGSTQPALTIIGLKNIDIFLPPLPEQRAIAGVLSSLDDKIDLLHRQNKTLEDMAETLFRQWFVEEETNRVKLGDIIEIFDNKRVPLSSMQRDKMKEGTLYPYYGAATIMDYINQYIFDGEYLLLVKMEQYRPMKDFRFYN